MDTTFSNGLSPSFYGKQVRSGVPAYVNNGDIRTVGGYIATSNTNPAKFGYALYADPAKPSEFVVGTSASATVFRGLLLNQSYVNEQLPAHADRLLNGQPASAVYSGVLWCELTDFASAQVGGGVVAGADGSLKTGSTAPLGTIVEIDTDTSRVAVKLN